MKKVVVFLQNAWSPHYAGKVWPRKSWLAALERSRSGQRLRNLRSRVEGINFWFDNTTPEVGPTSGSVMPADKRHMAAVIREQKPDIVLCMGAKAAAAWQELARVAAYADLPVMFAPHPAYRVLTNQLLWEIAWQLEDGFEGQIEMKQERPAAIP